MAGPNPASGFEQLCSLLKGYKMKTYKSLMKMADRLVNKLQDDITTGKKRIYENYGQKQISQFIDKYVSSAGNLTYLEKCNIKDVLYKVSSIS